MDPLPWHTNIIWHLTLDINLNSLKLTLQISEWLNTYWSRSKCVMPTDSMTLSFLSFVKLNVWNYKLILKFWQTNIIWTLYPQWNNIIWYLSLKKIFSRTRDGFNKKIGGEFSKGLFTLNSNNFLMIFSRVFFIVR